MNPLPGVYLPPTANAMIVEKLLVGVGGCVCVCVCVGGPGGLTGEVWAHNPEDTGSDPRAGV